MADNTPNKKDIQDAKKSLGDFNDALKESIDYAKQLSKVVNSISLDRNITKSLASNIKSYNDALKDTLKLSDKVAKGKVKQNEIDTQTASLAAQYNKLLQENGEIFGENGEALKNQLKTQQDLSKLSVSETRLIKLQESQNKKIVGIEKQISAEQKNRLKNPTAKKQADENIKNLKKELRERTKTTDNITQQLSLTARLIDRKKEELEEIDQGINSYNELVTLYQELLELQDSLTKANKEQTILGKLRSKDIKKQAEGIKGLY
jgi:ABC-type transporter Mla subunit MlaD